MTNGEAPNPYAAPRARSEPPSATPTFDPSDAEPAGFGIRTAGRLVDTVVAYAMGVVANVLVGFGVGVARRAGLHVVPAERDSAFETIALTLVLSVVGSLGYHVLSEGIGGASVGKLVLGLRVRSGDYSSPHIKGALIRSIAYYFDAFFFGAVAYSSMSNSDTMQRWGDKWGDTVVVKAASVPPDPHAGVRLGLGLGTGIAFNVVVLMVSVLLQFTS